MKSWWIASGAGGTSLELREVPEPAPKAGEVLVRMRAAGLNRGEFLDLAALHARRLRIFGVSNKMRGGAEIAEGVRGFVRDVLPSIASGHLRPLIDKVYPFAELPAAKARMEANAHLGKIVIRS